MNVSYLRLVAPPRGASTSDHTALWECEEACEQARIMAGIGHFFEAGEWTGRARVWAGRVDDERLKNEAHAKVSRVAAECVQRETACRQEAGRG